MQSGGKFRSKCGVDGAVSGKPGLSRKNFGNQHDAVMGFPASSCARVPGMLCALISNFDMGWVETRYKRGVDARISRRHNRRLIMIHGCHS